MPARIASKQRKTDKSAKNGRAESDADFRPASLAQLHSHYPVRRAHLVCGRETHHQTTLAKTVRCAGVGLHSGAEVRMALKPAPADSGIVFIRRDVNLARSDAVIPALFSQVCQSTLCSTLGNQSGASVRTVEHVMAALAGLGVDNAYIELDGPEVPVMDGSAAPFVAMIDDAGLKPLARPRRVLKITRPVRVENGDGFCALSPSEHCIMEAEIDFPEKAIGRQRARIRLDEEDFRTVLAPARTFCRARDVATMRAAGLALGGSLANAVVVDGADILNAQGLRYRDEFARHKLLDALGDLYLAGLPVIGHYQGRKAGHTLHNKLLHAVFAARAFALLELMPRAAGKRAAAPQVKPRAPLSDGGGAGEPLTAPLAAQSR